MPKDYQIMSYIDITSFLSMHLVLYDNLLGVLTYKKIDVSGNY